MPNHGPRWLLPCLIAALLVAASDPAAAGRHRLASREHALNRAGFGPDAWSRGRIAELDVEGYLEEQLQPETIPDAAVDARLAQYPSLTMDFEELRTVYGFGDGQIHPEGILSELQQARILRAVASRRQLQEVLVDFWFNHFNVDASGNRRRYDISPYDRLVIRPHVLGRFEDLLLAVARSPAMGDYLDNRRNFAGRLNENYSRELLELHTLSVDGGYSEADVVEVARCFTGWREDNSEPDGFRFDANQHDDGPKSIMGALQIPAGGGYQDGLDVIQFLASHPRTAEFISRKLVVRFVSEEPPPALVAEATGVFLATDGDLREVVRTILLSPEFLAESNRRSKVKRPLHLMASLARVTGADPSALDLEGMSDTLRVMGENLFRAGPPTGYPDRSDFWTNPGVMLLRFNALERGREDLDGSPLDPVVGESTVGMVYQLILRFFADFAGFSPETSLAAFSFVGGLSADPEERLEQAAAYLLSSPEFQTH